MHSVVKSDAPLYKLSKKCISAFISHAKRANKSCSFMLRADRRKEESSWDRKNHAKIEREKNVRVGGMQMKMKNHAKDGDKECIFIRVSQEKWMHNHHACVRISHAILMLTINQTCSCRAKLFFRDLEFERRSAFFLLAVISNCSRVAKQGPRSSFFFGGARI